MTDPPPKPDPHQKGPNNERNRRKRAAKKLRKAKQRGEVKNPPKPKASKAQQHAKRSQAQAKKPKKPKKPQPKPKAAQAAPQPPGGHTMPAPLPRRATNRTPASRNVYEVAKRQEDGKTSRPTLLEAATPAELAADLARVLDMDEPTSKAAAVMLSTGAAIVADTWQGQTIGRMEFVPATKPQKAAPKKPTPEPEEPGAGLSAGRADEVEAGSPAPGREAAKADEAAQPEHAPEHDPAGLFGPE